ncbi:MAG TPA: glycoside hydrolase family 15 protein [Casimicrobiaceae bacterium]|nr:glycoside hydrolase family 15 protein [Casimicrobiaceae bacterium]
MHTLDLALIGNGAIGLLVDSAGSIVWGCFPRFDGDATFCALLDGAASGAERGIWAIDLVDLARTEQSYVANTAVLTTRLFDKAGGAVEITDCVPRFAQFGRLFHPVSLVRHVRKLSGSPRIVIRLRPAVDYGRERPAFTVGSGHIRFVAPGMTLRLTTNASLTAILEERAFFVNEDITLLLGPDETVTTSIADLGRRFVEETVTWWRGWVRRLAIPFEWQGAVIRAAITLQLNAYADTGAIIAAMTTSIPESAQSSRNWDYRYCWLRDGYFVVDALNRLNATETMEHYLRYIVNIAAGVDAAPLQPVYRINGDPAIVESVIATLPGYRGMGPVRIGNDAYRQVQHDVYGSAILAATHVFFDERLIRHGDSALFERLEELGYRALAAYDQPDAGLWELRGNSRVHTFSAVMCWAGCDRLTRIATKLGNTERATEWGSHAARIARFVDEHCWDAERKTFVSTADGSGLDASLLLLAELGFLAADDPRFVATVDAIGAELRRGDFIFRYVERDDFGEPENAFLICTFWYVNALAAIGRRTEARALFERLLACRTTHGLLAEHLDLRSGELWGNFPQTYSMVGLITSAIRLSLPWDEAF